MKRKALLHVLHSYLNGLKTLESIRDFDNMSLTLANKRRQEIRRKLKPIEVGDIVCFPSDAGKTVKGKVVESRDTVALKTITVDDRRNFWDVDVDDIQILEQPVEKHAKMRVGRR